jgi:hypothetical protein
MEFPFDWQDAAAKRRIRPFRDPIAIYERPMLLFKGSLALPTRQIQAMCKIPSSG